MWGGKHLLVIRYRHDASTSLQHKDTVTFSTCVHVLTGRHSHTTDYERPAGTAS